MIGEEAPPDMMFCDGIILDGLLAGKPCRKLLRAPSSKVPVKCCPRCHKEHVFKRYT